MKIFLASADFTYLLCDISEEARKKKKHPLGDVKTLSNTHAYYLLSGRYFAKIHNIVLTIKFFLISLSRYEQAEAPLSSMEVIGIDLKREKKQLESSLKVKELREDGAKARA